MNEESIKNSENVVEENNAENIEAETTQEEIVEDINKAVENEKEGNSAPKDFIDEFAPASIVIPNYDKEKELRKIEKINLKKKQKNSKKSKKRRRLIKKIVDVTCTILLTLLLFVVAASIVSSVIVRINTSGYAVESAIKNYGPERLIVGKVRDYEKLGMNRSAENASMADILRDNAEIPVTYAFIEQEVNKSTYPEFISGIASDIIGYYLLGTPYRQVEKVEIENLIYKNSSRIKTVTGQELNESDCNKLANYISKASVYKEISVSALGKQRAAEYTTITSVLFSFTLLIGLILAFALITALIIIVCKKHAYKIIGWTILVAGVVSGIAGFLIKPMYTASTAFVQCIVDAVTAYFNTNALIYGIVVAVIGILVLLIGSAIKDNDSGEDDYYDVEDKEYIEEAEQVSTAL